LDDGGSFKALGESELAARLPSVLMGVGTLLLIYLTARMVRGSSPAFSPARSAASTYHRAR